MRKLVGAAAACCVLAGSTVAMASPDFVLDGTSAEMSGKYVFRKFHLINGAKLTVKKGTDAQPDSGRLYVIAHEIVIDETSSIDGTGAGNPGQPNGNGLPPHAGGGKGAIEGSDSGGGGGYGGKGGAGVLASCLVVPEATGGGLAVSADPHVGSSGSAAGSKDGDEGGRGGAGGGLVDLRASTLKLLGQVIVDGEAGGVYAGEDSAGGGSGGAIWLQTSLLDANAGMVRANGGVGGKSSKDEGGSGGGGTIFLHINARGGLLAYVDGGKSACPAAAGGDGVVNEVDSAECLDLDQDGVTSKACGGQDCDDSDKQVNPGATEVCNGQDDDCDGGVDDGASADCPGGACVGGKCVVADGGEADAADADANGGDGGDSVIESGIDGGPPDEDREIYEFRGGCAQSRGQAAAGWLAMLVSAAMIVAGRVVLNRRRQRRTSARQVQRVA